jgi:hypothetical protein
MTWLVMLAPISVAAGAAGIFGRLTTGVHRGLTTVDWVLIGAGFLYFAWWLRARRFPCPKCGYNLARGRRSLVCPSCGLPLEEHYP